MRLIGVVLVLSFALMSTPRDAETQQAGRVYRLGILSPGMRPRPSTAATPTVLPMVLREMGYVAGHNLVIEFRFADGKLNRLSELARELVQLRVDALIAASPPAVQAAKAATTTIPIVMMLAYSDPVELGLVATYARPGGNVTGVAMAAEPAMAGKRLELIKEVVPHATRIAVLSTGETPSRIQVQWVEKAAATLGIKLIVVELRDGDYDGAFASMVAARADALFVVESTILSTSHERIIQLAAKHRLPAIYDWREHAQSGGLIAYGGSLPSFARRAAVYVDKIFKGASPEDLPVERATTFELVINLKTAKALGLTIPQSVLVRADEIIQ
jgi:ABC-type uncharacterized transport system substrate-binding protein